MNQNKGYIFEELPLAPLEGTEKKNKKLEYLKFLICFILTPTTATTILLMPYLNPYLSYLLACIFWGTILWKLNKKN